MHENPTAAPAGAAPAEAGSAAAEPTGAAPSAAQPAEADLSAAQPAEADLLAASPAEADPSAASPAAGHPAPTLAETAAALAERFPALFTPSTPRPIKLRIQADIQQRAPGVFTKKQL